jgi:hypothetical protein
MSSSKLHGNLYKLALTYQEAGGDTQNAVIMSQKDIDRNIYLNGYMTGKEWYERFEKETSGQMYSYANEGEKNLIQYITRFYERAARRAAGLKDADVQ